MVRFFGLEKFFDACHVNSSFRYDKYYPALREDNVKNFAIFCYDYFEDLLALITFAKNFSILAGVASKIFGNKHTYSINHNGN